jgi:hypothetical protein
MKAYDDAIAAFLVNKPVKIDASLPEGIKMVLLSLVTPYNLPFSRELWMYRLSDYLPKISEPVQVVIGKKDIQVDWKVDGKILEEVTAQKTEISFVYPENANHVLKHEDKPRESLNAQNETLDYNSPNSKLDQKAADTIFDWLKKQVAKV